MNEFHYKVLPTAEQIHADPRELIAVVGAWGSGKSTIAAMDLYQHCLKYQCDALVIRDTYPALKDSCVKKFMEIYQNAGELTWGPPPTFRWSGQLRGREVMFRSAEGPGDTQKFGSVEVGYAWLEEVCPGRMPGGAITSGLAPEVLSDVIGRVRKWHAPDAVGKRRILLTSLPPPSTKHWFHTLFYDRRPLLAGVDETKVKTLQDQIAFYRLNPEENLPNLPPNYYETQAVFLTSEDQVARFLRGEVGSSYGQAAIYAEQWNDAAHIKGNEPVPGPMILGLDGGLDASAVWLQVRPDGRMTVLAELVTRGLGLEDFGLAVLQHGGTLFGQRTYDIWADPAIFARSQNNARDGAWYLGKAGLRPKPAPQDPQVRVSAVRTWLSRMGAQGPLLQVHPRCELLIEGFRGGYHWKTASGVPIVGRIDKNEFSHPHDALQYPLAALTNRMSATQTVLQPLLRAQVDQLGQIPSLRGGAGVARYTRRNFKFDDR